MVNTYYSPVKGWKPSGYDSKKDRVIYIEKGTRGSPNRSSPSDLEVKYYDSSGSPVYGNVRESTVVPQGATAARNARLSGSNTVFAEKTDTGFNIYSGDEVYPAKDPNWRPSTPTITAKTFNAGDRLVTVAAAGKVTERTKEGTLIRSYEADPETTKAALIENRSQNAELENIQNKLYNQILNKQKLAQQVKEAAINKQRNELILLTGGYPSPSKQAQEFSKYKLEERQTALIQNAINQDQFFSKVKESPKKESISDKWQKANEWLANKTTRKIIPSKEWILQEANKTYSDAQANYAKGEEFNTPFNPIKINKKGYIKDWSKHKIDVQQLKAIQEGKTFEEYQKNDPMLGFSLAVHNAIREKPLNTVAKISAGATLGFVTGAISSAGTLAATTVSIGNKALGGMYALNIGKNFIAAANLNTKGEILGSALLDLSLFGVGAYTGSKAALSAGFTPKPSAFPSLRLSKFTIQNDGGVEGEPITLFRGLEVVQPSTGRGTSLIGHSDRIQIGSPKLDFSAIKSAKVLSVDSPTAKQIIKNSKFGTLESSKSLPESDPNPLIKQIAGDEKSKFQDIIETVKDSYKKKGPVYVSDYTKDVRTFSTNEAQDYLINQWSSERTWLGRKAVINYGTTSAKIQMPEKFRVEMGESGDYDTFLFKSDNEAQKLASSWSTGINKLGERSFIDKTQPLLIQSKLGSGNHMVDIHTLGGAGGSKEQAPDSFYGIPFSGDTVKLKGVKNMAIGETGARKAASILTPWIREGKVYFAPAAHRLKDVKHFFIIQESLGKDLSKLKSLYPKTAFENSEKLDLNYNIPSLKSPKLIPSVDVLNQFGYKKTIKKNPTPSPSSPKYKLSPELLISSSLSPFASSKLLVSISPSKSPSPSRSPSPSFYPKPSPSPSKSPSPSRSPSPSLYPKPSPSPSKSLSPSRSPSPSFYPKPSPSPSKSLSPRSSPPSSPKISIKLSPDSKLSPGFNAYIKSFGKWVKVNKNPLNRISALSAGSRAVANTSSATFRIMPTDKGAISSKTDLYYNQISNKFRTKISPRGEVFNIEKNIYRINTGGELNQITFKGRERLKSSSNKSRGSLRYV